MSMTNTATTENTAKIVINDLFGYCDSLDARRNKASDYHAEGKKIKEEMKLDIAHYCKAVYLGSNVLELCFNIAWEESHSNGYYEVAETYKELLELAESVYNYSPLPIVKKSEVGNVIIFEDLFKFDSFYNDRQNQICKENQDNLFFRKKHYAVMRNDMARDLFAFFSKEETFAVIDRSLQEKLFDFAWKRPSGNLIDVAYNYQEILQLASNVLKLKA